MLLTVAIPRSAHGRLRVGPHSSAFRISHVRVTGTALVPTRTVAGMLRGRFLGRNLFAVTTADVRAALHTLPYVQDAELNRDFPDTLKVTVVEYRPALYVLATNGWFTVADDGYVICPASVPPGRRYVGRGGYGRRPRGRCREPFGHGLALAFGVDRRHTRRHAQRRRIAGRHGRARLRPAESRRRAARRGAAQHPRSHQLVRLREHSPRVRRRCGCTSRSAAAHGPHRGRPR